MNKADFNREINYQIIMFYVKQLKSDGTITDEEYKRIDTIMLKKYSPVLGTLLSGNSLT